MPELGPELGPQQLWVHSTELCLWCCEFQGLWLLRAQSQPLPYTGYVPG